MVLGIIVIGALLLILLVAYNNKSQSSPTSQPAQPPAPPKDPLDAVPDTFVVFDVETTGLDPQNDEIIEIGAIKARKSQTEQQTYTTLVKPTKPIPQKITDLTGITNEMVEKDGIPLENALEEFREFIGTEKLVAFNKDFDKDFINFAAEKMGKKKIVKHVTCAYRKAKAAWYGLKSYKLADLAKLGGLSDDGTHRALADCKRTLIVYIHAAQKVKNQYRGTRTAVGVLLVALALSGCAKHMANVRPEWNPVGGKEAAREKCLAASQYAWVKQTAYQACMAQYGYEMRPGPRPTE